MGAAPLRPMRIKSTVKDVEIVVPFHTGMCFHLAQAGHVPHKGPDVGRILRGRKELVWFRGRSPPKPHKFLFLSHT